MSFLLPLPQTVPLRSLLAFIQRTRSRTPAVTACSAAHNHWRSISTRYQCRQAHQQPRNMATTTAATAFSNDSASSTNDTSSSPPPHSRLQPPAATNRRAAPAGTAPRFAPRRAALTITPKAVDRLRAMLTSSPDATPQLLKVGTKKKGCSGLSYSLEYVTAPGRFDEVIEQDGVKVVVDSKALFTLIGSEMDWVDDVLHSEFVFNNPNVKEMCGCGESFMV
ncbi:Iron-sulfur assembly protein 1 [Geranomyces michiganensis]|nr:Iron-sulfur assembly protein 1 [Geranomyces michiganensis]